MKKLGFGTMRLPLLPGGGRPDVDFRTTEQMVDLFMSNGFSYFDTAYPYHDRVSEQAVRQCLTERYPRDAYYLADKMPILRVTCPEDYPRFFQEQLDATGAGYFDYYLLHNLGRDRYRNVQKFGGFEFLSLMKEQGLVKNIGFSFHDTADVLDQILTEHPEVDVVQLQLNYIDWESPVVQSRLCYETCVRHGKPVIVMEPVKGGILANLPEEALQLIRAAEGDGPHYSPASYAIRFAASLENVFVVLSGMSTPAQMEDNLSYMDSFKPLSCEEQELIVKVREVLNRSVRIPCTSCRYCMEVCPMNIHIPAYFGLYNMHAVTGVKTATYYERALDGFSPAKDCLQCGMCEGNCPQHIEIRAWLQRFADLYER